MFRTEGSDCYQRNFFLGCIIGGSLYGGECPSRYEEINRRIACGLATVVIVPSPQGLHAALAFCEKRLGPFFSMYILQSWCLLLGETRSAAPVPCVRQFCDDRCCWIRDEYDDTDPRPPLRLLKGTRANNHGRNKA